MLKLNNICKIYETHDVMILHEKIFCTTFLTVGNEGDGSITNPESESGKSIVHDLGFVRVLGITYFY